MADDLEDEFALECDEQEPLCSVCGDHGGAQAFVQCENVDHGCNGGQHFYCFSPPIREEPENQWFCMYCRTRDYNKKPFAGDRVEQPKKLRKTNSGQAAPVNHSAAPRTSADGQPSSAQQHSQAKAAGPGRTTSLPASASSAPARAPTVRPVAARTPVPADLPSQPSSRAASIAAPKPPQSMPTSNVAQRGILPDFDLKLDKRRQQRADEDARISSESRAEGRMRERVQRRAAERLASQKTLSEDSLKGARVWQGTLRIPSGPNGQAVTTIAVKAQGIAQKAHAHLAAKRLPLTLNCRVGLTAADLGIGLDDACDASVLLMTADPTVGNVAAVTEFGNLWRTMRASQQVMQVDMGEDSRVWLALVPNACENAANSLWVAFVAVDDPAVRSRAEPTKSCLKQGARRTESASSCHWPDGRQDDTCSHALTIPEGPAYCRPHSLRDGPDGSAAVSVNPRASTSGKPLGKPSRSLPTWAPTPNQERPQPLQGFKYSVIGYHLREQGIWDRMKDLARLGAQHYQRPCSGAGINAIIVSESSCLKGLHNVPGRDAEGKDMDCKAMDDVIDFLLDHWGATRFFRGLSVLDLLLRLKQLPDVRELPEDVHELMACGVIIVTHLQAFSEGVKDGSIQKIMELQARGRQLSQGRGAWTLKMHRADVEQLGKADAQAFNVFNETFGTTTACISVHEESKGNQPDPPKLMRDALKVAHTNMATARHVVLMTTDQSLLSKMTTPSANSVVHACPPADTVQLLTTIVEHLPQLS